MNLFDLKLHFPPWKTAASMLHSTSRRLLNHILLNIPFKHSWPLSITNIFNTDHPLAAACSQFYILNWWESAFCLQPGSQSASGVVTEEAVCVVIWSEADKWLPVNKLTSAELWQTTGSGSETSVCSTNTNSSRAAASEDFHRHIRQI